MSARFLLHRRISATRKTATISLAAAGAAVLAFTLLPAPAGDGTEVRSLTTPSAAAWELPGAGVSGQRSSLETQQGAALRIHVEQVKAAEKKAAAEKKQAAKAKAKAAAKAEAKAKAKKEAKAKKAAAERRATEQAASRSTARSAPATQAAAPKAYSDNLDGWIREALDIMERHGIPGSYEGLHRNIMRESSGNPRAINNWDINAKNGTPSKGLLQVIQPTFDAYHVPGTPYDLYHPVANIVPAANYAADRYGSIDNVDGPY